MKTKAQMVVDIVRSREFEKPIDDRLGFQPVGTHRVTVMPPHSDLQQFGGAWLHVELTPGHDLRFHLRELRTAIENAAVEARKERADRPGESNS